MEAEESENILGQVERVKNSDRKGVKESDKNYTDKNNNNYTYFNNTLLPTLFYSVRS